MQASSIVDRSLSRKIASASVVVLVLAGTLVATASPASARWGRNAALFGGLAAGAVVAGALATNAYAAPAYEAPAYAEAPECWREKRPVYNRWGDVAGYRSIRVCN